MVPVKKVLKLSCRSNAKIEPLLFDWDTLRGSKNNEAIINQTIGVVLIQHKFLALIQHEVITKNYTCKANFIQRIRAIMPFRLFLMGFCRKKAPTATVEAEN